MRERERERERESNTNTYGPIRQALPKSLPFGEYQLFQPHNEKKNLCVDDDESFDVILLESRNECDV